MKMRALLIACAVALGGTQAMAQGKDAPKAPKKSTAPAAKQKPPKVTGGICTGAQCDIDVAVPACNNISVDYEMLKVKTKKAVLRWTITDASSTFAANGIVFKSGSGTIFTGCKAQNGNKEWQCVDENPQAGVYKYSINVVKGGTACPTLDPDIINDP